MNPESTSKSVHETFKGFCKLSTFNIGSQARREACASSKKGRWPNRKIDAKNTQFDVKIHKRIVYCSIKKCKLVNTGAALPQATPAKIKTCSACKCHIFEACVILALQKIIIFQILAYIS